MTNFSIVHFAIDGEFLGGAERNTADLSPRWMDVCSQFFNSFGPVFSENMGSTLSRYEVKCSAGMFEFSVSGILAFVGAVLIGKDEARDQALVHFLMSRVGSIDMPNERPLFVIVNLLDPNVTETDQGAVFDLALHFAAAYVIWSSV